MKLTRYRYVEIGASGRLYDKESQTDKTVRVAHIVYGISDVDERPYCLEHDCFLQACRYDHPQVDDLK